MKRMRDEHVARRGDKTRLRWYGVREDGLRLHTRGSAVPRGGLWAAEAAGGGRAGGTGRP